ncbi:MAG: bifunctional tRNA (5-methylaminomethyl-2-thiouridine)(34)-methyltransferase MnmD/FAD-dependent 5-carboxymethylaminomethyl-2-thiouridine(34) oxidoreductase MnmC [Saccharospirillum sp.]
MERPDFHTDTDGTPRSARFDDVYFSREGGLAETRFVFLEHNRLSQRFAQLAPHQSFVIAETGFGTGLNFLSAWALFDSRAPADARLVYISAEKYPLSRQEIQQSLSIWPELTPRVEQLLSHYPPAMPGYHCLELAPRVELWLLLGDAAQSYNELNGRVDAWFLDGFAPAKNPEMWQPALFAAMARLSHRGTTLATFTSARLVRDGLTGAGFQVTRAPGFGRKRDMIRAEFIGLSGPPAPGAWPANEWAWPVTSGSRRALVIGAGLAGAHTARELADRGWQVTVLDQHDQLAGGASGNPQGALYARLSHQPSASNRFYESALLLAQRRLRRLPQSVAHQPCGLLQLNQGTKEARRFTGFREQSPYPDELVQWVDARTASDLAGVPIDCDALHFRDGGWICPPELVAERLSHPNIEVRTGHTVTRLHRCEDHWQVDYDATSHTGRLNASQVILATAWQLPALGQTAHLPVKAIAGQITQIHSEGTLTGLTKVLCSDRYLVPAWQGKHSLGATFHLNQPNAKRREEDDRDNLQQLHKRLPGLIPADSQATDSRASVRAASPDYLPMVGPVFEPEPFVRQYARALQQRRTQRLAPPPWQLSLWVNSAHGSKGLCSVPLTAKLLACWLSGEPLPLEQSIINQLNPNRFLIRELIRSPR